MCYVGCVTVLQVPNYTHTVTVVRTEAGHALYICRQRFVVIICNTLIYRVVLRNHQAIYKFKLEHDHEQIMTTSLISDGL